MVQVVPARLDWLEALAGGHGGEEFTVLLPNTSVGAAEVILERLRTAVTQGQTCSIGLAVWDGIEDPNDLVARADEALYHAKRHGRNRLAIHDGQRVRDSVSQSLGRIGELRSTHHTPEPELDLVTPVV